MPRSVPNVPTHEEFFGLNDNYVEDREFEAKNDDEDIERMLLIMLGLLQEFYILHMYDTAHYYSSEQFKDDITDFNSELKDNWSVLFSNYVTSLTTELDATYGIPTDKVDVAIELEEIINSGIDSVTMMLYYDLRDNAMFYTDLSRTTGVFSPHSNFRRAIRKLTNQIDFKGHHVRKVIERTYDEFIYGQEALFTWVCSGVNTCNWCYEIEAMGAMPLSWFPIDHIHGNCKMKPVNPDEYSEAYNMIRRGGL